MREIIKITIALTVSCLMAGIVVGVAYIFTAEAKKHNEHLNVQKTMFSLLGYGKDRPVPAELKMQHIYRYIIENGDAKYLGYMLPIQIGEKTGYELIVLDLAGQFVSQHSLDMGPEEAISVEDRKIALAHVIDSNASARYADAMIVAALDKKRIAYLLPSEFPGFKTFITAMLALDADFGILGLEVIEHEEDPGLGGEIEQAYFKNQFAGKSFEKLKKLKVVKEPLPDEYRKFMESEKLGKDRFSQEDIAEIEKNYKDKDIYALTGATISSVAVTNGLKRATKKFVYRIQMLDRVIASRQIPVAF
ncbi:FMN-binding protein [Desulfosarcina sp.]|uniref:FMN-binding protein n=1 Tax=Desulfosarcina sp. TaxID=2027861 RepID=UPI0029BA380A|nr:FMN-binding protein [Desulfosarcina sp.]MDX2454889.1 FMN-binding protein [Desulfosarcina sp.]